jgi:hypothetical protein
MAITIKTRYIVITSIALLCGIFFFGWRLGYKKGDRVSTAQISALNGEINRYVVELNNKTTYVAEIEQQLLTQKEAVKKGAIENAELKALNLKKVNEVAFLKGQVKIFKDSVAHTGNIIIVTPCDSTQESRPAIELPFTFRDSTTYYDLMGGFNSMGRMRIDLTVPISIDVWFGLDRDSKEYKTVVTTDNPIVNFTEIRSLKFDLPRPKKFGIGIQAGYGFNLKGGSLTPYIGLGASWNILRF